MDGPRPRHLPPEEELDERSEASRSQYRNRVEARRRLAAMIEQASRPPKRRIKTRPSRRQREKRLDEKRHRKQIRRLRKPPKVD